MAGGRFVSRRSPARGLTPPMEIQRMHAMKYPRFRRATGAAVALVVAATACDRDVVAPPIQTTSSNLELTVQVSSAIAQPGQRIAVIVGANYREPLGGLQGYLRFNPSR